MANPVVHFEIIGKNGENLRAYYAALFDWTYDTASPVAEEVAESGNYGFIELNTTADGVGIPGGVGGGAKYENHAIFYVGVPNVGDALTKAESLGGKRVMGPARNPNGELVVAHFRDPEGNIVGLAGPQ